MIRYHEKTACPSRVIAASSFLRNIALLLFRAIRVQQINQKTQTSQKQPICIDQFAIPATGASRVWSTLRVSSFAHRAEPAPHASVSARGHLTDKDCWSFYQDEGLRPKTIHWMAKQARPNYRLLFTACRLHGAKLKDFSFDQEVHTFEFTTANKTSL